MTGIRIKNGATFIKEGLFTFKVTGDTEVSVSDVMFEIVEHDMSHEPADSWDYLTEGDIKAMDGGVYEQVIEMSEKINAMLNRGCR